MKRITGYQATDGKLFSDKKECAAHQAALNIAEGLKVIGDRMDNDESLRCDDLGSDANAITNSEDFARFVMANAADIKLALAGKPLPTGEVTPA